MNILVIGGSGFIGTRLVSELLERGHQVRILDLAPSQAFPAIYVQGDVRDRQLVRQASADVDVIYLLAAEHRDDVRPTSLYQDVNVGGAQSTVAAATDQGVRTIVFTSSVAVYGPSTHDRDETTSPQPVSEYGRSKLAAEGVITEWAEGSGDRSLVIIRPTVVFGEGNRGNVYNLIRQVATGRFVMVGEGKNRKSMCYVGNLVPFMVELLDSTSGVGVFNYVDKPDLDMNRLVSLVRQATRGRSEPPLRVPYHLGLALGYVFDGLAAMTGQSFPFSSVRVRKFCEETRVAMRAAETTSYRPPFTLEEGLTRMIQSLDT